MEFLHYEDLSLPPSVVSWSPGWTSFARPEGSDEATAGTEDPVVGPPSKIPATPLPHQSQGWTCLAAVCEWDKTPTVFQTLKTMETQLVEQC